MSVVSAAHGVLGPLLGKLAELLAGKFGRVRGVRKDILSLQAELTSMHAALQEYTMLEDPGLQVKAWISLLRELAYDTEDCIDKFIRHIGKRGRRGGFKEFFRSTALLLKTLDSRCGIADQVEELKARIKHVKELKDSYKLSETPSSKTEHAAMDPRLCALFAEEAHLVGVQAPRDDLVKWMLKEENSSTKDRKVLSRTSSTKKNGPRVVRSRATRAASRSTFLGSLTPSALPSPPPSDAAGLARAAAGGGGAQFLWLIGCGRRSLDVDLRQW